MHNRITVSQRVSISSIGTRMTRTAVREWGCANTSAARCQPPLCKGRCPEGAEGLYRAAEVVRRVTERDALSPAFA